MAFDIGSASPELPAVTTYAPRSANTKQPAYQTSLYYTYGKHSHPHRMGNVQYSHAMHRLLALREPDLEDEVLKQQLHARVIFPHLPPSPESPRLFPANWRKIAQPAGVVEDIESQTRERIKT